MNRPTFVLTVPLCLFGLCAFRSQAAAPSTQMAALDDVTLRRGQQIRAILLKILDQVDRANGIWPQHTSLEGDVGLKYEYTPPGDLRKLFRQRASVVINEQLNAHPTGVWVGYADGHVEFCRAARELAESKEQIAIFQPALARYGDPFGPQAKSHESPSKVVDALKNRSIRLRLLDPHDRPVEGALIGVQGYFGNEASPDQRIFFLGGATDTPMKADSTGEVVVSAVQVFSPHGQGSDYLDGGAATLYVRDDRRGLIALEEMHPEEFDGRTREVHLHDACNVVINFSSFGLQERAEPLRRVGGFIERPGRRAIRPFFFNGSRSPLQTWLPPGDFGVFLYGPGCYAVERFIHVDPAERELTLFIDLPARAPSGDLAGHPAPELRLIKGWKNGGPVSLAQLRGKVVLLDFWAHWCGPCLASMPELMKLHDKYKDRGLVVIGIHEDSVGSIAEMDEKVKEVRGRTWGGRDLPFLVALDGGGPTRIAGTGETTLGATNAAYRVTALPSTFLIDRDGTVVGEVPIYDADARPNIEKQIQQMLDSQAARRGETKR